MSVKVRELCGGRGGREGEMWEEERSEDLGIFVLVGVDAKGSDVKSRREMLGNRSPADGNSHLGEGQGDLEAALRQDTETTFQSRLETNSATWTNKNFRALSHVQGPHTTHNVSSQIRPKLQHL